MASATRTWAHTLKGTTLGGRYLLGDVIGVGGMGAVFQGVHKKVGRQVAIKLLVPDLAEDEETGLRFHQEAQAAARIARKGVVEIFDFDDDEEYGPYLIMELLRGEPLSKRIKRRGKLEPVEALSIGVQMTDALASVHGQRIVHRDLKPANVFLSISEEGEEVVKLLDFGISRVKSSSLASGLTKPGVLLGTPRYMSPEQAWCKPDVDHRTDLYAVGAIMYHALAGVKPYQDLPQGRLLEAVLKRPPKTLQEVAPDLPAALYPLIGLAMERDRDQRFQTAEDMRLRMIAELEGMARGTLGENSEMSDETPMVSSVDLNELGETLALDPPPSLGSGTPPPRDAVPPYDFSHGSVSSPTPAPQSDDLAKTTVGYTGQSPSVSNPKTTSAGYREAPSGGAEGPQRRLVSAGNIRALPGPESAAVYESGAQSGGSINTPAPRPLTGPTPIGMSGQVTPPDMATGRSSQTGLQQSSASFETIPKKRSIGKVIGAIVAVLIILSLIGAGGLWLASWLSNRDSGGDQSVAQREDNEENSGEEPGQGTPPSAGAVTPGQASNGAGGQVDEVPETIRLWRSELQIARNERELGQLDRARQRLSKVATEVEEANAQQNSSEARIGTEACLLLGDLEVRAINAGQAQSAAPDYLNTLSTNRGAAHQYYERALRFGVGDMEQCTLLGMARSSEWAAEAALRSSRSPGLAPEEVARRQNAWRSYLDEARNNYQRAQGAAETHGTCGPQASEGLTRIQARLAAQGQ